MCRQRPFSTPERHLAGGERRDEEEYSTGYTSEVLNQTEYDFFGCRNRLEPELPGTMPQIMSQKWLNVEMPLSPQILGTQLQ